MLQKLKRGFLRALETGKLWTFILMALGLVVGMINKNLAISFVIGAKAAHYIMMLSNDVSLSF